MLANAVVQANGVAVHFCQSQELEVMACGRVALGNSGSSPVRQRGRESHRAQAFEIDLDHGCV